MVERERKQRTDSSVESTVLLLKPEEEVLGT